MNKTIVVAAVAVLAVSGFASTVSVSFETSSDVNQFTGGWGSPSWIANPHGSGHVVQSQVNNNAPSYKYSPGGVDYLVGAGTTISVDCDAMLHGHAGLLLQQKSISEQYKAFLQFDIPSNTEYLTVGNFDQWGYTPGGHTGATKIPVGNFYPTPEQVASNYLWFGWYHMAAVVSTVNTNQYKVVVTVTDPSSNSYTATYIDSGTARYTYAAPVGLAAASGYYNLHSFDNFQIVPEPATMCLLALGGLAMVRRRQENQKGASRTSS